MNSQDTKNGQTKTSAGRADFPDTNRVTKARLLHSSRHSPCPVCDRKKDRDCSFTEDYKLVNCHSYAKESPPKFINGYKFTGKFCNSGVHPEPDSAAIYVKHVWESKPIRPKGRTTFIYKDAKGNEIVKVERTDDGNGNKHCPVFHKEGFEWKGGIIDAVRPLIHLYRIFEPLNQKAKENGELILLVEGEPKVNLLLRMGIPATCNLGGSGSWKKHGYLNYLDDLKGARVVICPDRDNKGMKFAEQLAQDFPDAQWLYAFPDSPEWNNLPPDHGLDIYDWIQQGSLKASDVLAAIGPRRKAAVPADPVVVVEESPHRMMVENQLLEARFSERLRYNTLLKQVELDGERFDLELAKVSLILDHGVKLKSAREDIIDMVIRIAKRTAYNPIVEYLDLVVQRYGGNTHILDDLAARYLGTDDLLHQTMLKKFLIQAVNRAYKPGCKADYVLILQGKQGTRKSTFFKVLAGEDWFDDCVGDSSDKDERLKLHRTWFVEWAEVETAFTRKGISRTKAFVTNATDTLRPPYERGIQSLPRPSVLVGTTNEVEFLTDPTGGRRFWVVPVAGRIDTDRLLLERDQIWAAAVALYRGGEQAWLTEADEEELTVDREQFESADPWLELIRDYLSGKEWVRVGDILNHALTLPPGQQGRAHQNRVTSILSQLGWQRPNKAHRRNGVLGRYWKFNTLP